MAYSRAQIVDMGWDFDDACDYYLDCIAYKDMVIDASLGKIADMAEENARLRKLVEDMKGRCAPLPPDRDDNPVWPGDTVHLDAGDKDVTIACMTLHEDGTWTVFPWESGGGWSMPESSFNVCLKEHGDTYGHTWLVPSEDGSIPGIVYGRVRNE